MITIDVKHTFDELTENIGWWERDQIPFALAKSLTATAKIIAGKETETVKSVFDKPNPFTRQAIGFTPATKAQPVAWVFVKDAQVKYLINQIEGGRRAQKRFEQRFGEKLQGAMVVVPGARIKLDQYGNITKAQILQIAADLNTAGSAKRFFMGKPRGGGKNATLPAGIYARVNNNQHVAPLMVFAHDATYRKRFEFSAIGLRTVDAEFERQFQIAWDQAIATRR